MQTGLPPELDALKNTIRQVVKDECVPLEAQYLANPPQEGQDDGHIGVEGSQQSPEPKGPPPELSERD